MTETNAATTPPTGCDPKSAPWVDMEGTTWWVPSFSFAEIGQWFDLARIPAGETFDETRARVNQQLRTIHGVLARNHPDLTFEQLLAVVPWTGYGALVEACMAVNDLKIVSADPDSPTGTAGGP